jgi:hypothetical protein
MTHRLANLKIPGCMILTIHLLNPQILLCYLFVKTFNLFLPLAREATFRITEKHKIRSFVYFNGGFSDGQREDYELEGSERAPN